MAKISLPMFERFVGKPVGNLQTKEEFKNHIIHHLYQTAASCEDENKLYNILDPLIESLKKHNTDVSGDWLGVDRTQIEAMRDFFISLLQEPKYKEDLNTVIEKDLWEEYYQAQEKELLQNMGDNFLKSSKEYLTMILANAKSDPIKRLAMALMDAFIKFANTMEYKDSKGENKLLSEENGPTSQEEIAELNKARGFPANVGGGLMPPRL